MRFIVTGVKDGKSCVLEAKEYTHDVSKLSVFALCEMPAAETQPAASPSDSPRHELKLPVGNVRWMSAHYPPNTDLRLHYTDSIDWVTVITGSVELVLDDGAHRLVAGDSVTVSGVDHGWWTGAEGCVLNLIIAGAPPRAAAG